MSELPRTLAETFAQCETALLSALADGKRRLQIDIKVPGIELLTLLEGLAAAPPLGEGNWAAAFADPGAAALARRRLGDVSYALRGLSEFRSGMTDYSALVVLEPSAVEVDKVEALATQVGNKPLILLNSRLQEAGVVGIGLAGRQLRERFLSTLEPVYIIQPFSGGSLYRAYPDRWQLWREEADGDYSKVCEFDHQPSGEQIDRALSPAQSEGLFAGLRRFLRALGQ
ncbi:DUF1995 family protein [Gloeobacter kilaueensis]|uniref:Nucleotide kinase n=1 Tax=Gloeobacter kilaueensis (strain ATCC BAA-2537 / CCAP 1431/1 / ULC 316 / JS1) TaxID=1183438 RepID=U5QH32_GLOK1|nr:DUF1995 family protein [Gloeobacter kilaueensis]AGY58251.1 nucleotide kinase [Gloeobacter kilaueensis JS1]